MNATLFWSAWYGTGASRAAGQEFLKALNGDYAAAVAVLYGDVPPAPAPAPAPQPQTDGLHAGADRVDFFYTSAVFVVNQLVDSYGHWHMLKHEALPPADVSSLEDRLAELTAAGWTVRRWPGGARAWKHGLVPVRKTWQIKKLRDELREHPRPELQGQGWALDLRYDL